MRVIFLEDGMTFATLRAVGKTSVKRKRMKISARGLEMNR